MTYDVDIAQAGTGNHGLSVHTAAALLTGGETIVVGVTTAEDGPVLPANDPAAGMCVTLWENPLGGEPGEHPFTMRWAGGSLIPPGLAEADALQRVIATATRIARLAAMSLDGGAELEADPGEFDLVHALAAIAIAALRSPHGTSPAGAAALTGLRHHLGIDGATPVDDAVSAIRTALEASHADR
jgi:hypothetical protein